MSGFGSTGRRDGMKTLGLGRLQGLKRGQGEHRLDCHAAQKPGVRSRDGAVLTPTQIRLRAPSRLRLRLDSDSGSVMTRFHYDSNQNTAPTFHICLFIVYPGSIYQ